MPAAPADPYRAVRGELLVRCLDAWVPRALHGPPRATYLDGYATAASVRSALAVFVEFGDLLSAGRRLGVILVAPDETAAAALAGQVAAVRNGLDAGAGLSVQTMTRRPDGGLPALPALSGAPTFSYLDASAAGGPGAVEPAGSAEPLSSGARADPALPGPALPGSAELSTLLADGRGELLLLPGDRAGGTEEHRAALRAAGAPAVCAVELLTGSGGEDAHTLLFAGGVRGVELFKEALWAVDEYAGTRYRDPRDPEHAPVDISLTPHPGPLRRALLAGVAARGPQTVAQLRRYAVEETIYRGSDVTRALTVLLASGALRREPPRGRLTPDVLISDRAAG